MSQTFTDLLTTPTAHSLCDSGGAYGRAYQQNAKRDFPTEPQAILKTGKWGLEISISVFHHMQAMLVENDICKAYNALPCEDWDSEVYGVSQEQHNWLMERDFEINESAWNSYNWDQSFDQTVQGIHLEHDDEEYVLIQAHGGCDVRGGYTDAKLFLLDESDYFMLDDASFDLDRAAAEAAGYPVVEITHYGDSDWITIDYRGGQDITIYDHRLSDDVAVPENFWERLGDLRIEGIQSACEH
jgi:hypothetical protein